MDAIIRADGRQMRLTEGQEFEVGRITGEPGETVDYDVLVLMDGPEVSVGSPVVDGATLKARIEQHGKTRKLRFMKYKNKVRYRRTIGHRSSVTRLVVESISKG
ncbi:MAG: 50S ribosomal protein L21 [Dehalococcoidia bacterium]|nr:50S ribosomal protein L21 [Dehalococcoidia bacterium]